MAESNAESHVLAATEDGIRILTLNRPQRLNAWDAPMRARLLRLMAEAAADAAVQALVLTGTGDRAFCAGQDLHEGKTLDAARAAAWIEDWRALYGAVRAFEKPVVCALNGLAAGSGFQVALLCDIRIGHAGSSMGQPEINAGIVSATGFWIIREMLGLSRATEMVLTGRMVPAEECHRLGLLHQLVPAEEVRATALRSARDLAAKPGLAFRLNKARMREVTQPGFEEAFAAARRLHAEAFGDGGTQQAMQRFLDRSQDQS
ncbi:enoyl-CoA hydratase/isomerase family protein [Falsiroseomonas sp.]|uniref:enoyl-CoA hydratase/isomerase family protein n=1 Tax=Falsiroseomonas sp. TaxID=2870721 RepID=UPI003F722994